MYGDLLDFIAGPESGGRYDIAYGGTTAPLEDLTLAELYDWQRKHAQRTGSSAVGKYQFLESTLAGLAEEAGIDPATTKLTPDLQDQFAVQLLRRRGLNDYLAGRISREQFAANLAKEWAGLPAGEHGRSHYAGDKMGNAAGVNWQDFIGQLDRVRNAPWHDFSSRLDRVRNVDPRMAGGTGGYPVSPYSLPDKSQPYGGFAQEYPGSMRTPPINPSGPAYDQYLRDVGLPGGMPGGQGGLLGMDPMQYLRPNKPTLAEGLLAFGDLFQPPDRRIGGLEMAKRRIMSGGGMPQVEQLQAANELMQLQERSRANRLRMQQEQRNQQFQQRQADRLDALAAQIETVDPYQAEAYRNQAAAMRAGAVKEVYGLEPYVPPEPPGPPETTNINGVPHVYDQAQGTFVPATVMDPQTGQPTYARPEPSGPPKTTEINGVPHEYNPSTGTYSPVRVTTPEGDVDYAQPPASGPDIDFGNSVADDWRQESAPLTVPLRRYKDVKDYDPADLSPAQMRALIVNYAKFLDPTSAVMENEADAVANAGQAFPALRDLWRRAIDGKLPEDTARSIIDEMGSLAEKRQDELIEKHKVFSDRLRLGGITDPTPWLGSPVIVDFKEKESKNEEEDETYVPDPTVDLSEWDFGE
jgi:hypothetical protein